MKWRAPRRKERAPRATHGTKRSACYERSEPEGGVTVIITGGAGAPLYPKTADAAKQNPWSKVFASRLNYCVFEISGDKCEMKALSPEGELIDTRT